MYLDDIPILFWYTVLSPLPQSTGTGDFKCSSEVKNCTIFLTMTTNHTICSESKQKQLKLQCIGILNGTLHTLRFEYLAQHQYMKGNKNILAKKNEIASKSPLTLQSLLVCHWSYITKKIIITDSPRHSFVEHFGCFMFGFIRVKRRHCARILERLSLTRRLNSGS